MKFEYRKINLFFSLFFVIWGVITLLYCLLENQYSEFNLFLLLFLVFVFFIAVPIYAVRNFKNFIVYEDKIEINFPFSKNKNFVISRELINEILPVRILNISGIINLRQLNFKLKSGRRLNINNYDLKDFGNFEKLVLEFK